MTISAVSSAAPQIQPQQVSAAALKSAESDGDGRRGVAALNDGDAAAVIGDLDDDVTALLVSAQPQRALGILSRRFA